MKYRPRLLKAEMVRAVLNGTKTQTRELMKPQPVKREGFWEWGDAAWSMDSGKVPVVPGHSLAARCPLGEVGDRLWVRETFGICDRTWPHVNYRADGESQNPNFKWKPSIHMPRRLSRITLEITAVRVERLQDISEEDAKAEGVQRTDWEYSIEPYRNYKHPKMGSGINCSTARMSFSTLWDSIFNNWSDNPWVWVIEFKVVSNA